MYNLLLLLKFVYTMILFYFTYAKRSLPFPAYYLNKVSIYNNILYYLVDYIIFTRK